MLYLQSVGFCVGEVGVHFAKTLSSEEVVGRSVDYHDSISGRGVSTLIVCAHSDLRELIVGFPVFGERSMK